MPGGKIISGLVRLGINANWLLTGEGVMLLKDLVPQVVEKPVSQPINVGALDAILRGSLMVHADNPSLAVSRAVKFYMESIESGVITPTGIGPNAPKQAA